MITHIDHIVLTVTDVEASVSFYERVLGLTAATLANGRRTLQFGYQKINLQVLGQETRNRAGVGSGDVCLITDWPIDRTFEHITDQGIEILEGPVSKSGATGSITSVYFNDPDGNLIEVGTYG